MLGDGVAVGFLAVASYGLALGALPDDDRTAEEAGVRRGDDAAENRESLASGLL